MRPSHSFSSIFFDCDSTLSTIEGIDELAARADPEVRAQVVALTNQAMDGEVAVKAVYGQRLELLRPDHAAVQAIAMRYCETMVPDADTVVRALQHLGKRVGIVSGGLRQAVLPLAAKLGISPRDVHAVEIRFDREGRYASYEHDSPMTRNGGKPNWLEHLVAANPSLRPTAFVGDGITDLETATVADRFIGFGGVVRRESVAAKAAHYAAGPSLATVLQFCSTAAERRVLRNDPRFAHLLPRDDSES